uniref:Uncharacterized protein n=1 Tax=Paramormyrops kingsleyae TaxID=1676925 RepID=A0A3B3SQQ5_9TELE
MVFCCQDEEEFPGLMSGGGGGVSPPRGTPECVPPKLPKGLLDSLPEGSPISIVKTPIPITTSVPKRAKSQRKKALAAALATAQEYSEISWEQKKLQEALSKAAGKKSKTPVQLDLGDMLAALEKQQQAMKARQLTNTKPLSYTGAHGSPLCPAIAKAQEVPPLNSPGQWGCIISGSSGLISDGKYGVRLHS